MNFFYGLNNLIACCVRYSLLTIALLTTTFQLTFSNPSAQEILQRKVSLSADNENLKSIIKTINDQTRVDFVYSSKSNLDKVYVSVKVQEGELGSVLNKILPPTISYEVVSDKIVL